MGQKKSQKSWKIIGSLWVCTLAVASGCFWYGNTQTAQTNPTNAEAVPVLQYVSWGTYGDLVRQTQQRLQDLGYDVGTVDGIFGTRTYEAIRKFQQDQGMKVDGIAGNDTLERLGISIGSGTSGVGESGESDYDEDLYLLASIIHGEARGEPYEGQVAVGAVVLNRVASPDFPNTIAEVIFQPGAFDAVEDQQFDLTPNETALNAARDALNGWDPTNGALYYWNPVTATSRWIWSVPITTTIGRHVFGVK